MCKMTRPYNALLLLSSILLIFSDAFAQSRVEKHLMEKRIEALSKEAGTDYFLVVGDWGRNGQGDTQDVADWMGVAVNRVNAKFIISTGDNFYCCGVASTEDHQWMTSFENVFRSHALQIPWYVTLGNHDYQGNVQTQIDYEKKNQRWKRPDRYFTKVLSGVRFVFLDTSPLIHEYYKNCDDHSDLHQQDTLRQLVWLDSVLSKSTKKKKIVVGHHPIYSVGEHGSDPDLKRSLEGVLEKHNVTIYFAGHDHNLQSLQRKDSKLYHLVSGAGSEHTPLKNDPTITRFSKETTGFMVVALQNETIKIYFIESTGKIIYTETIRK